MLRVLATTALILGTSVALQSPQALRPGLSGNTSSSHSTLAPGRERRQAIDDAAAASLVDAVARQFGQRHVDIRLGPVDIAPAGLIQREVQGRGELRIGDDREWIPFRFQALYDASQATTEATQLVLGDGGARSPLARTSGIAGRLDDALADRLRGEFAQQRVAVVLQSLHSEPAGGHYLALEARGRVDFGPDGQAETDVDALYDTRTGQWLQLEYRLDGASANGSTG